MIGDVVSSTSPIEVSGENLALASFEWFVSSLRRRSLGVDKLSVVAVVDDDENSNKDSKGGSYHMLRGGSWNMPAERLVLKSADRGQGPSSSRGPNVGLRMAMIPSGIPGSPEASRE